MDVKVITRPMRIRANTAEMATCSLMGNFKLSARGVTLVLLARRATDR